jgi:hypothetical protein
MSISKKGSRILIIAGERYRWRVRSSPTYAQALAKTGFVLAVEVITPPRGAVLIVELPMGHPSNWLGQPGGSVTPALVGQIVHRALAAGWQPHSPGEQFRLDVEEPALEPAAERDRQIESGEVQAISHEQLMSRLRRSS